MSTKTIADVRDHLFKLLDQLSDQDKTPDYERLRAGCEVAQVMVNTVRLQVDYLKIIQGDGDVPFLDEPLPKPESNNGSGGAAIVMPAAALVDPLSTGPSQSHPWRDVRVHRLAR
jgi:hypothetical protein